MILHEHHIVPRHMGGGNEPSNLIKVNVAVHAFLHKQLFLEHGHWQDELAWKALSGQVKGAEIALLKNRMKSLGTTIPPEQRIKIANSLRGRSRPNQSLIMKNQQYRRKTYEITHPNGQKTIIIGLVEFCKENGLNAANLCQVSKGKKKHHKNYTCKEIRYTNGTS